jgi:hypothetical protein
MSRLTAENQASLPSVGGEMARERYLQRRGSGALPTGLLVGGLVVVGLGFLAWYYLGPDLQRYMKIRNM